MTSAMHWHCGRKLGMKLKPRKALTLADGVSIVLADDHVSASENLVKDSLQSSARESVRRHTFHAEASNDE